MTASLAIAVLLPKIALWGLLAAFAGWVYHRIDLRSTRWLGVYLLLYAPLSLFLPLWHRRLIDERAESGALPFGWSFGALVYLLAAGRNLIEGLIHLLLALLILADVVFLLRRAGIATEWRPARLLLGVRRHSASLGLALVGLIALLPLATVVLWVA